MVESSMMSGSQIELDGRSLSVEDVLRVAQAEGSARCVLSPDAVKRMTASQELKKSLIASEQPIYGVTTGFGDSSKRQISPDKAVDLQRNMVRYHMNGMGPLTDDATVRATMLIRANCLARGNSGVRVEIVSRLLDYLEHDILPEIPERGSVGASGDLVPHSYVAASVMGEGHVKYRGERNEVSSVLEERGLDALVLEAKEGLALINGTSFMSAFAALAVAGAEEIAFVADVATAMTSEALLGNRGHFAPFLHEQKPHPGQVSSAGLIANMLADSNLAMTYEEILESGENLDHRDYLELGQHIQDKYSVRCAPHVTGVLRDTLTWVRSWVETEINSSDDNPLFDAERGVVHNGGNFYGGHIAQAMDSLKVSLANIADLLDRQMELIVDEKFNNGLTPNLTPDFHDDYQEGLHHGFKGMQIHCSALTAEALKLANPVSVFSRSTEAHNQDKVSMGSIAARDARTILELVQNVCAVHLHALCQALDLRGATNAASQTRAVYELIRSRVSFVDRDRRMDDDVRAIVELIRSGSLRRAVAGAADGGKS